MDATVHWDPVTSPNVVSYNVYHGYAVREYFESVSVPGAMANQYAFTGLDDFRTHHFAVTAMNTVPLESLQSIDVQKRVPHRFTMK